VAKAISEDIGTRILIHSAKCIALRHVERFPQPIFDPEKVASRQGMSRIDWARATIDEALNLSMRSFAFAPPQGGCGKNTFRENAFLFST
jgi:hypothetical protein